MKRIDRKRLHRQLVKELDGWSRGYKSRAAKAADRIIESMKKDRNTPISQMIHDVLRKEGFHESTRESIGNALVKSVAHGYGIIPEVIADPERMLDTLMEKPWSPDGLSLSKRLYRNSKETESLVAEAIQTSIRRGDSFVETARMIYDGYGHSSRLPQAELPKYMKDVEAAARGILNGEDLSNFRGIIRKADRQIDKLASGGAPNRALKAAYRQMLDAAERGSEKYLEQATRTALEEKSRYRAERIARSEMARAYAEGFVARNKDDGDIVGYKWELGSRHPRADICDFHAESDLFGMGAGVYPKDNYPELPAHPHCLCHYSEVFADEAEKGKYRENGGDEYLDGLPEKKLRDILGKEGSRNWQNGTSWAEVLRLNLSGGDGSDYRINAGDIDGRDGIIELEKKGKKFDGLTRKEVLFPKSQEIIDGLIKRELGSINFSLKPKYNNRVKNGRTLITVSGINASVVVHKVEIGRQERSSEHFLLDSIIHEELEARIAIRAGRGVRKFQAMLGKEKQTHAYILPVVTRYFRMRGWLK